jgi:hypothetical protein
MLTAISIDRKQQVVFNLSSNGVIFHRYQDFKQTVTKTKSYIKKAHSKRTFLEPDD